MPTSDKPIKKPKRPPSRLDSGTVDHRDYMADRRREGATKSRNHSDDLTPEDVDRRNLCIDDLRLFMETYFPHRFPLAWSEDQLKAIHKLQTCILDGGLFAYAMPRGTGKTSYAECAALWAVLYGHRTYVVPISATQELGSQLVEAIKNELMTNELLAEDFKEACLPIIRLEGINQRTGGQTWTLPGMTAEPTRMDLSFGLVVLPTIAGSACSGSCIEGKGLTGSLRGMKRALAGGKQHRPDLVILDDPQTDETAHSPTGNRKLERIINGAVLGLAGPRKKIAAVMPCTVIAPDDMVDRILDQDRNPQWNGERSKMLVSPPERIDLWDEYAEIRRQSFREHGDGRDATAFYRANRSAMDNGAKVSWAERYNPDDLSALQFAMNWKIDRPRSFAAECQNEPEREGAAFGMKEFDPSAIGQRMTGLERGIVPTGATRLTAFVDVGGEILWYAVVAWNEQFGGSVIDYGTLPRQNRSVFAADDARPSLSTVYPGQSPSQRVFAGLTALLPDLMGRTWQRQNGGEGLRIERAMVDAGWGETVDAVYQAIARFTLPVYPSKGYGRSTSSVGVAKWKPRPGERSGFHWRLSVGEGRRGRQVQFDPDAWKTFVHAALCVPVGGPTGLTLFGAKAGVHELFAEHLNAEYSQPVTIRGDSFDKWSMRPDRQDNHWLDCYSSDMETLTRAGWRLISDLTYSDELATVNLDTDLIEYQKPTNLVAKRYAGEMIQVGGGKFTRLDMLVTPTHRMVIYAGQSQNGPMIREASGLTIWDKIKTTATWIGSPVGRRTIPATSKHPEVEISEIDLANFLGWYIAEGSCCFHAGTWRTMISQMPGEKAEVLRGSLNKLPWKFHQQKQGFMFSNRQVHDLVKPLGNKYNKRVPQWIKDAAPEVIKSFIAGAVDGDGWRCRTGEAYATVSKGLADDMMELWLKAGFAVSMRVREPKGSIIRGRVLPVERSHHQYHVHRKTTTRCQLRDSKNKPNFRKVPYDGMVYCASVPNGTLIVRRNGKVAVCGNCLVGCAVAASVAGVTINATGSVDERKPAKPISLRELQEKNRQEKEHATATPAAGKKVVSLRELQMQNKGRK